MAYTLSEGVLTEIACDANYADNGRAASIELSGQAENTEIYIMVVEYLDQRNNDDGYRGPFYICAFDPDGVQDPPANDTYQTATTLSVQPGPCSTQTQGDLTHATDSNDSDYSSNCLSDYYGGATYVDVWYKATVPGSGKLTIETSEVSGSATNSTTIVAYTLSEGTLTEIGCDYFSGVGSAFSKLELSDQAENTVVYVMVTEFRDSAGYHDNNRGPFYICALDPTTLDFPHGEKPLLSYYSNPVGNRLSIESPYQIQSLAIYDLGGREVLSKQPDKQKLTLDTYSLSAGVYMLSVQTAEGDQTVKLVKK
ncbi:MAG: T9SS type A sorting domain-containing protein [Flavobacteriaceae bacterium]|nr:T9SS type A sorting domain-containing protein [Flavobacteriaceae bacterium]